MNHVRELEHTRARKCTCTVLVPLGWRSKTRLDYFAGSSVMRLLTIPSLPRPVAPVRPAFQERGLLAGQGHFGSLRKTTATTAAEVGNGGRSLLSYITLPHLRGKKRSMQRKTCWSASANRLHNTRRSETDTQTPVASGLLGSTAPMWLISKITSIALIPQ